MRRLLLIIIALATLFPSLAQAYDILVLQSRRDPGYEEAVKGFRSGLNTSQRLIILSDYSEVDVDRIVREDHPKLILAVGDVAMKMAGKIRYTPVVAIMAIDIDNVKASHPNMTGISMFISPENYIKVFKSIGSRRIGLVYNPEKSGWYLRHAKKAALAAGITLVVSEVSKPRETPQAISSLAGKVDSIWMLPDVTAVTQETIEAYFRFGQQQHVPLVAFSTFFLSLGASNVLEIDRNALGRQASAIASEIMEANSIGSVPVAFPERIFTKSNAAVFKHLVNSVNGD